ncbi:hypothetical protein CF319_g7264 [Tilletia indica]|nr:hypothetical protein CF319_g7264 [Tilletia indica]
MIDFGPQDLLSPDEREALVKMTLHFDSVFAFDRSEKGRLNSDYAPPYIIKTVAHEPWIGRNIPLPKAKMTEILSIYNEQLQGGDLEPSDSPYSAPHFFVEKKNGKLRKVVDLSSLNKVTIRDANIPPNIIDITEQLAGRVCYGSADVYSFFHQIILALQSRPLTAIRTPLGLLKSTVFPQGATNSPAYAQRVSTHVFQDEIPHSASVFVDDLIMMGPKSNYDDELYQGTKLRRWFVEYLKTYARCLRQYQNAGLTVSREKIIAIAPRLSMTGFVVDHGPARQTPRSSKDCQPRRMALPSPGRQIFERLPRPQQLHSALHLQLRYNR